MIRVKHAPSAAAIGESAYTIGRGEKKRWLAEHGLKQQALGIQAASVGASARARAGQLALQEEALDFRKQQWQEEPARQLEKSLQHQELLQKNLIWQYSEGQKREMAHIIEGISWLRSRDDWTPEQKEKAERQLWQKYYKLTPLPVYDDSATPQERFNQGRVKDETTGEYYMETTPGVFKPMGISYEAFMKARADAAKAFTTIDADGNPVVDYEKAKAFVDEGMLEYTKIQGFAARAEEEQKRRDQKPPEPSAEEQANKQAAVEALPTLFETIVKGQPKIGRKKKGKPSLFADDVYGEKAYNKVLVEAVERGKQEGIPPDVMKAELDKWWDAEYDKERGQRFQKFGNRMEFEAAPAPTPAPTPAPAAGAGQRRDPMTRQKAIDYVKSVLQQGVYASLDKKTRSDIGVKMLAEAGIQVTAEELSGEKVRMKAPNGEIYEVDHSEVKEAKKHGWVTF